MQTSIGTMSITAEPTLVVAPSNQTQVSYRALSPLAVVSLSCGLLSIVALLDWPLAIVPGVGIVAGLWSLARIRSRPDELAGGRLALWGVALSLAFVSVGWGRLGYIYYTEVPEGYERIGFSQLQPDPRVRDQIFPPGALALDGQKVFIKGYVMPGPQTTGIRAFVMVPDSGTCCFGGTPKLTDTLKVKLLEPLTFDYDGIRQHGVAGVLRVIPQAASTGAIYYLEADYMR